MTPREREIALLLIDGKTSKLIARQIGLSPRTVEMHRSRLMRKFDAANSSELVYRSAEIRFLKHYFFISPPHQQMVADVGYGLPEVGRELYAVVFEV